MEPTTLAIAGELSIFTAAAIRQQLLDALAAATKLSVDLSQVSEIDSAGLQIMIAAGSEAARQDKELRFVNISAAVLDIVGLCGLTDDARLAVPAETQS